MPRRPRSDSAQGRLIDIERAATERYPAWPRELVPLPTDKTLRSRTLQLYGQFCRHRVPEGWAPSDPARLALLSRTWAFWERETFLFAERGGDDKKVARLQSTVALLSRQLGLNVAPIDGRQAAAFAGSRAKAEQMLEVDEGDDLLARPRVN
jgi:hypothetical protein